MADVNASLDSLVPDAKNTVLRDTGVKTALDRANAKMPITYVIRYRDVFAGRDFMVKYFPEKKSLILPLDRPSSVVL